MMDRVKRYVYKKYIMIWFVLLCACIITGCHNSEEVETEMKTEATKTTEATETGEEAATGFIACDYDLEREEYIAGLMKMETDENTLVIYTSHFYNNDNILELNQLLEREGYPFHVQIRQVPDTYLYAMDELAFVLEEKKIAADIFGEAEIWLADAAKEGAFLELNQYLDTESGKNLKEQISEKYWELTGINDRQYFIGFLDNLSASGWEVNKKLMDKYGFTEEDLAKPLGELEDIFRTVWEGEKDEPEYQIEINGEIIVDFSVFALASNNLLNGLPFSFIDVSLPVGYWSDEISGRESKIELVNIFDTERMRSLAETVNRYYQEGYVKNIKTFPGENDHFFMQLDYSGGTILRGDSLDTWTNTNGIVLKRIPYYAQDTSQTTKRNNAILKSSSHQEEAFEFLVFVMTNQEASEILFYGREGIDYERLEDGSIKSLGELDQRYSQTSLGNLEITSPLVPYEDVRKPELLEKSLDMLDSPACGFYFNDEPVKEQAEAVRELYSYVGHFRSLFMFEKSDEIEEENWEEYYDNYCQMMKEAGIDELVEEMNRQLEDYLKGD